MENKKILLITNQSNTVINFRKELINHLQNHSNEIFVISGDSKKRKEIEQLGVHFYDAHYDNRSKNIFSILKTKRIFAKIIKEVNPDIVFTFQLKPNTLGVKAAHKCKIRNIVSMVEGLGDPFQPKGISGKIVKLIVSRLYKTSLKFSKKVFFLNSDDMNYFLKNKLLTPAQAITINGIGIDTNSFKPLQAKATNMVLTLGRLIINKGIFEFCEIARQVRSTRKDISFVLCGEESQIKKSDIKAYIDSGDVIYLGEISDVKTMLSKCKIYLSTSYREGFPRTIMEAMAMGKPVFATDVIGNRELVKNNQTGYLLPNKDINAFSSAIISTIDNDELLNKFGDRARKICVEKYDAKTINTIIENELDKIMS